MMFPFAHGCEGSEEGRWITYIYAIRDNTLLLGDVLLTHGWDSSTGAG